MCPYRYTFEGIYSNAPKTFEGTFFEYPEKFRGHIKIVP
jgi:hypothetical protein